VTKDRVDGGKYYGVTFAGRLVPLGDVDVVPDKIICRRVADFPRGVPPPGAAIVPCVTCGASVAMNPKGPHRDRPFVCMQCEHVQPLPIEDAGP